MEHAQHFVDNGAGWKLAVKQTWDSQHYNPKLRPLLIVPSYGMNAFIFGYHPKGESLEEHLAKAGFEVWSANFRNQGGSIRDCGSVDYGMADIALGDLAAAVDYVVANNQSENSKCDLIGCSLGGAYAYTYAALKGTENIGAIVGMGAPFRWVEVHPILAFAFKSRRVAKALRISHTRTLARYGLPLLAKIPAFLSIYLHTNITDISHPEILTQTVEDPNPHLNAEISDWIRNKDLIINEFNLTQEMQKVDVPIFALLSNADGIVPPATALSVLDAVSSTVRDSYTAGDHNIRMAHADMYISDYAKPMVFEPLAHWLLNQN